MRVLFWSEGFWPHVGGVSVIASQFVAALKKRGLELAIIARAHPERPSREEFLGIPVYRLPFSSTLVRRDLKKIRLLRDQVIELEKTFQPDLLHIYENGVTNFFNLLSDSAYAVTKLYTIQAAFPRSTSPDGIMAQMLRSADWVTTVSQAMLDDACRLVPQVAGRSSLIYNGLEMPALDPAPLTRDRFESPRLLCAGRVVRDKGFDVALEAFPSVLKRFPRARLVIAGDGDDRIILEQHAVELGVRDSVEFMGWVLPEKMPELINRSTMVVMPSRWREPFGLVALQAGQMARPIVATRVGGLAEVVVDRETGLLVENESSAALADAILFVLEHPQAAREMGQQGRRRAMEKFSMERYADEYEQLYQRLARSDRRPHELV